MNGSLVLAATIALPGSILVGCATRDRRAEDTPCPSALAHDVPDSDRQFPFGPLPFIARPDPDQR